MASICMVADADAGLRLMLLSRKDLCRQIKRVLNPIKRVLNAISRGLTPP